MPNVREVVQALNNRDGVSAVFVIGNDGLAIDQAASDAMDAEAVAALLPSVVQACNRVSEASGHGGFGTSAIEFGGGKLIVTELTEETLLAIFTDKDTNIGPILYDITKHKPAIAELL